MSQGKSIKNSELINEVVDEWQQRSRVERRSNKDNRSADSKQYFARGGKERRKMEERRQSDERRDGWMRAGKWRSVSIFEE